MLSGPCLSCSLLAVCVAFITCAISEGLNLIDRLILNVSVFHIKRV